MALAIANFTEINGDKMYPTEVSEFTLLTDYLQGTAWNITARTSGQSPFDFVEFTRVSDSFVIRVYIPN